MCIRDSFWYEFTESQDLAGKCSILFLQKQVVESHACEESINTLFLGLESLHPASCNAKENVKSVSRSSIGVSRAKESVQKWKNAYALFCLRTRNVPFYPVLYHKDRFRDQNFHMWQLMWQLVHVLVLLMIFKCMLLSLIHISEPTRPY